MKLQQHALSATFPAMPPDELKALAADIKTRGQYLVIYTYEGKVLDGWHRYQACLMVGKEPRVEPYRGEDPVGFVKTANFHRRQMTASQRSLVEVALSEWRKAGNVAPSATLKTNAELAESAQVSPRTIRNAKAVHAGGSEALKDAVIEGTISVKAAAESLKPEKPKKKKKEKVNPLVARVAELEAQLETATENLPELSNLAASAEVFKDKKEFKDMMALRAELDATRRLRDELMNENAELKKTVGYWKKRAEKAEKQIATLEARIAELEKETA